MSDDPTLYRGPTTPPAQSGARTPHLRLWIAGGITGLVIMFCCAGAVPLAVYGSRLPTPTTQPSTANQHTAAQPTQAVRATAAPTATARPTTTPKATAIPPAPASWQNDEAVSGNGNKTTQTFSIPFDVPAQLTWTCDPSSSFGGQYNLIVSIYNDDGTIADYGTVNTICQTGNTSGSTALQGVSGWSGDEYLQILSEGSWTVKVQSYY